jgi:hypothetical protein
MPGSIGYLWKLGAGDFEYPMDETLKKQFDTLCTEFGMNTTTAVTGVCGSGCPGAKNTF